MGKLDLSLDCRDYDRVRPLMDGRVRPDGINLNFQPLVVEETFFRSCAIANSTRRRVDAVPYRVADAARTALCRDPGLSVAGLPAFLHLHQRRQRHPRSPRPDRQARGCARIPDDGAGLDPRHPVGTRRRAARQHDPCDGGARNSPAATKRCRSGCPRTSVWSGSPGIRPCRPCCAMGKSTPR